MTILEKISIRGGYIEKVYNHIHRDVYYYGYLSEGQVLGFHKSLEHMENRIARYLVTKQIEEPVANQVVLDQLKHVPLSVVNS